MAVKLPSGSRMGLAMKCAGSVLLPQVVSEPGVEAQEGTKQHATLEKYFSNERRLEGADAEVVSYCERVSRTIGTFAAEYPELGLYIDPNDWSAGWFVARRDANSVVECRLSNSVLEMGRLHDAPWMQLDSNGDSDGGRVVRSEPMEYEQWRAGRYVAVADLVGWNDAKSIAIWDWKSAGRVPEPRYNWQLLLPAIAIWIICGRPDGFSANLGIGYVSAVVERYRDELQDGIPELEGRGTVIATDEYCATDTDIQSAFAGLQRLQARLASETPETVTLYQGKHCAFCPARHRCPAVRSALCGIADTSDLGLIRTSRALIDHGYQLRQMEINILKEHGGELDLGDGRIAVLTKDWRKKDKVYTKRAKQARSNASETNIEGTEGGGDSTSE